MANITASLVKDLRERTGAGMMECKKALTETDGDLEAAADLLRKKGSAQAAKKAGRIAAEGVIGLAQDQQAAALVEVNSETDFVAKQPVFQDFANQLATLVADQNPADLETLLGLQLPGGEDAETRRTALVAQLGENLKVRRFVRIAADDVQLASYLHGTRIGVIISGQGGAEGLGRDLAMHVAASRPLCINESEVPAETLAREKEIYKAQAMESGKPENIAEKMVEGKMRKYLKEVTLLGQPFVKDPDISVQQLLQQEGASVKRFVRFEVGEGLEKRSDNFAEEVMAQARGA
ncbi:MAG: translation elongation factor Ts [Gammaproteobacteria bacterium]|nr:translation elongation factor Ts [Gammaproteobacteria bacterium]